MNSSCDLLFLSRISLLYCIKKKRKKREKRSLTLKIPVAKEYRMSHRFPFIFPLFLLPPSPFLFLFFFAIVLRKRDRIE